MISNDSPRVIGTGTALPANYVDQEQLTSRLRELWQTRWSDLRRFDKIQSALGITGRHLALPIEQYIPLDTFAKTNDAWMRVAPEVGTAAAEIALKRAGLKPRDVDHLFFVTVTGIAVPSIDTRVISALGMRKEIKRTPIFGLGCVAGAAGVGTAAARTGSAAPKLSAREAGGGMRTDSPRVAAWSALQPFAASNRLKLTPLAAAIPAKVSLRRILWLPSLRWATKRCAGGRRPHAAAISVCGQVPGSRRV